MHPPKTSVILPYFNAAQTLERAVKSILNQTFTNFELILTNNNSTDKGTAIAEKLAATDKRIILSTEQKQGVVFASNKAASLARGGYIARMDADDEALPKRLEWQLQYLDAHPKIAAVAGMVEYLAHKTNTEGFKRYVDWSNSVQTTHEIALKQFMEMPVVNPSIMWRKELGDKLGLYRQGNFPEDYELWLRWLSKGVKIAKLPKVVLKWYDSDMRLTRTKPEYSDEAFFRIKSHYLAQWLQKNNPHHPYVYVWGASRISRKRTVHIEAEGIQIKGYIDTNPNRVLDKPLVNYKDLPGLANAFILVYLKESIARNKTISYLESKGFKEGVHYLLVS